MASDKQTAANIANAQRSTGPRSPAGKATASTNAVKHGFWATKSVLLPDEDAEAFEALRQGMLEQFQPLFPLEVEQVEELSTILWRLRRVPQIEAGIFQMQHNQEMVDAAKEAVRAADPNRVVVDAIQGPESAALVAAQQRLRTARSRAKEGLAMSVVGFQRDVVTDNSVEKLGRHETRLQNRMIRILHTLAALQAGRVEATIVAADPD
jgi:hypothetical protein